MMVTATDSQTAMRLLLRKYTPLKLAAQLCVHNVHVYKFQRNGTVSKTLERALHEKGVAPAPPTRIRISADVTSEQRDCLHALAAERGLTWSEFCRALASGEVTLAG